MRRKVSNLVTVISLVMCVAVTWRWRDSGSPTGVPRVMLEVPLFGHVAELQELTVVPLGDRMIICWLPGDYRQLETQTPPAGKADSRSIWGDPRVIVILSVHLWNGERAMGLMAPHWFGFLLTAALPLVWTWRWTRRIVRERVRARRARLGLCLGCGYDLRGTPQRCPECGKVPELSPQSPHTPPIQRTVPAV